MNPHPSNRVTLDDLDNVFSYHDDDRRIKHYQAVREAAKLFCRTVLENCPSCADRSAAIRSIREAVMQANASIALAPHYPFDTDAIKVDQTHG
jgi:hypothetical protein